LGLHRMARLTRFGQHLVGLVERGHLGLTTALVGVGRLGRLAVGPLDRPWVGIARDAEDLKGQGSVSLCQCLVAELTRPTL
jgi:hypothetical protein